MTSAVPETVPDPADEIGERVRQILHALIGSRRFSVARVARDLGEPESWLRDRLKGRTRLSIEEASRIAVLLGSSLAEVVTMASDDRYTAFSLRTQWAFSIIPGDGSESQLELPLERSLRAL